MGLWEIFSHDFGFSSPDYTPIDGTNQFSGHQPLARDRIARMAGRRLCGARALFFYPAHHAFYPTKYSTHGKKVSVYYNEFDPKTAAWLRELIKEGHIADGYADERSITEVKAHELTGYSQHHFFAGIGGWSLALRLAGIGDDEEWCSASCPCQPFSGTGKQLGNADPRHLFPAFRKLVARFGPAKIIGEQVASGLGREWLARVRLEMATLGYATRGIDMCSAGVSAPNIRQRLYWMADADGRKPWNGRVQSSGEYGQFAEDGGVGGVGDAMRIGRNKGSRLNRKVGGSRSGQSESAESDGAVGLVQSNGTGRNTWQHVTTAAGHRDSVEPAGAICGLGYSHNPRPQERDERGNSGCERTAGETGVAGATKPPGDTGLLATAGNYLARQGGPNWLEHTEGQRRLQRWAKSGGGSVAGGRRSGYWSNFDILHCTDGKARRIEPGTFPLATGIPGRVGLLRGYGNAINVEAAAAFIQAARAESHRGAMVEEDMS